MLGDSSRGLSPLFFPLLGALGLPPTRYLGPVVVPPLVGFICALEPPSAGFPWFSPTLGGLFRCPRALPGPVVGSGVVLPLVGLCCALRPVFSCCFSALGGFFGAFGLSPTRFLGLVAFPPLVGFVLGSLF